MKILSLLLITALLSFSLYHLVFSLSYKPVQIPRTFIDLKAYQTAKELDGSMGGICLTYAVAMNRLFPETQIIQEKRHVKVLIFANSDYLIWTDSNRIAPMIVNTWVEFRN